MENTKENSIKKIPDIRETYPPEIKNAAFERYLKGDKYSEISQALNVPEKTINTWQTSERWKEKKEEIRSLLDSNTIAGIVKSGKESLTVISRETPAAFSVFYAIIADTTATPADKERAAKSIKVLIESLHLINPRDAAAAGKLSGRL